MATARFRGAHDARVIHTVDGQQCVHEFADPVDVDTGSRCFVVLSAYADDHLGVPITSQPAGHPGEHGKPEPKEPKK